MSLPQLYTITSYSLLKSTVRIQEYVKKAQALGYQTLAITDVDVMHGAVEFYEACRQAQMKPLFGLQVACIVEPLQEPLSLILYAKNVRGYQQLMQLSSWRMTHSEPLTFTTMQPYLSELLVVLAPQAEHLSQFVQEAPAKLTTSLQNINQQLAPAHFFIGTSLTFHAETQPVLFALFEQQQLSFLALQEVRYLEREEHFAFNVLQKIASGDQLSSGEELVEVDGPLYLREAHQLEEQLMTICGKEAVQNARKLAASCTVEVPLHQKLLPHYPVPTEQTAGAYLDQLCLEKLPQRVANLTPVYHARLAKELAIIHEMGFDDYFLIVWDVMAFAHQQKIVTGAGRGSAAGSLVSYVLEITDVDPIQYDLLFERFLNPERHSMPDIDLDIPDNRREEVLHYVRQKYGQQHMAQIATFGTMAAKMVLRDVARVFGLSQSESNRWSKAVPNALKMTLKRAYQESKRLVELVESNPRNQRLFATALLLEGLPRHVSTHAAGVVISDNNLFELVPLQTGANDILLTQFTMNDVERVGLLKMDFLGLRNLSIIDDTLRTIKKNTQQELQLNQIPLDDPATLQLFQKGATSGIFQFESAGIRNVLRKLGPTSIEDIAAVNALYRPGPMQNIDTFVRRKKGLEPITYPDASLAPILENTYGIIVYQEQIMQVAAELAGFSLGQADILRRAISKKKKQVLDAERQHFVKGALAQGHEEAMAMKVYDYIERFADYGFNRSHAFAYSFIGFQMAYLKIHYPAAFYAAILHSVRHNPTKIREYISEARKNKLTILPPDINESQASFSLNAQQEIRFGFASVKGLRRDFLQNILTERQTNGRFTSFEQFLLRIERKWLKVENIEPFIAIGAFDQLAPNRRQLRDSLESEIQNIVFSGGSLDLLDDTLKLKTITVADYPLEEKLAEEEKYLGVYLSGHPTEDFKRLQLLKQTKFIHDLVEQENVSLLIYVKDVRTVRTKKGEQMAFVEGDDYTGSISLTIFPQVFRQLRQTIELNTVYYAQGKIERSRYNQELQLLVHQLIPASQLTASISAQTYYLKVATTEQESQIWQQLQKLKQHHAGNVPVIIYSARTKQSRVLDERYWLNETPAVLADLQKVLGAENVVKQ